jgi:hypothetical protein
MPRHSPTSAAVGKGSASTFARSERFSLSHKNRPFSRPGEADNDQEEQPLRTPKAISAITIAASLPSRDEKGSHFDNDGECMNRGTPIVKRKIYLGSDASAAKIRERKPYWTQILSPKAS